MKHGYTLLLVAGLMACNGPLSKKYSKDTATQDLQAIYKADSTAGQNATVALMKRAFAGLPVEGISYQELANEGQKVREAQQKEEAEQAAAAAKERAAEAVRSERLNKAFGLALVDIGVVDGEYDKSQAIRMRFENRSGKPIKAVKGTLTITDLFDDELRSFVVTADKPLRQGMNSTETFYYDYNQFMDEHTRMGGKSVEQVKARWLPEKIIFADGSTLE